MKKNLQELIRVEGSGTSKEQAINKALGNIQKKVMSKHADSMIIRIEPVNVTVVEAKEFSCTERFLLFFFPREKSKYKVALDVLNKQGGGRIWKFLQYLSSQSLLVH